MVVAKDAARVAGKPNKQRRFRVRTPLESTRETPPPIGLPDPKGMIQHLLNPDADGTPVYTPTPPTEPDVRRNWRTWESKRVGWMLRCWLMDRMATAEDWKRVREKDEDPANVARLTALFETFAQIVNMAETERDYKVRKARLLGREDPGPNDITFEWLLAKWERGDFRWHAPHPFTVARERMEAAGVKNVTPDLDADSYVDLVTELYRITGRVFDQEAEGWSDMDLWAFYEGVNRCVGAYGNAIGGGE